LVFLIGKGQAQSISCSLWEFQVNPLSE